MKPGQIAINSVSTAHPSFEETLKAYADAGFRQVEFVIPQIKKWMQAKNRTAAEGNALLQEYNLRGVGGFEAGIEVFSDEASRKKNHELLINNGKLLAELGGGVMVIGTDGPKQPSVEALDTIGKTIRDVTDAIPDSVAIAVEFNWSPIVKSIRSAKKVVDAANHPRVGILFDPAHYHCTSSKFEDLTEDVVKKILHVHVDDMRDKPGELSNCNSDRVLPGEGTLNLKELFGRIEKFGYTGLFSIEMFNDDIWKLPVAEAARRCYSSMKMLCDK